MYSVALLAYACILASLLISTQTSPITNYDLVTDSSHHMVLATNQMTRESIELSSWKRYHRHHKKSKKSTTTKKTNSTKRATSTKKTTTTKRATTTKKTTTTKKATTTKASSSGGSGSSTTYSGDGTYFNTGLGSCGITNTDDDFIVALNAPQMNNGENPNKNPLCGKYITAKGPKGTVKVKIVDTCPPCKRGDLDLSVAAFGKIADYAAGRVPITWHFD